MIKQREKNVSIYRIQMKAIWDLYPIFETLLQAWNYFKTKSWNSKMLKFIGSIKWSSFCTLPAKGSSQMWKVASDQDSQGLWTNNESRHRWYFKKQCWKDWQIHLTELSTCWLKKEYHVGNGQVGRDGLEWLLKAVSCHLFCFKQYSIRCMVHRILLTYIPTAAGGRRKQASN